jgi:hypothetical protein
MRQLHQRGPGGLADTAHRASAGTNRLSNKFHLFHMRGLNGPVAAWRHAAHIMKWARSDIGFE